MNQEHEDRIKLIRSRQKERERVSGGAGRLKNAAQDVAYLLSRSDNYDKLLNSLCFNAEGFDLDNISEDSLAFKVSFRRWFIFGEKKDQGLADISDGWTDVVWNMPKERADKIVELRSRFVDAAVSIIRGEEKLVDE